MNDLLECQTVVKMMMLSGRTLREVEEEVIDPTNLNADEKAALWLYAWAFVPSPQQLAEAEAHIRSLNELGD